MARNTLQQFEKEWDSTIELLKILSHPVRLYIVNELLAGEECSVGYFVAKLKIDFSNVSKQLAILRNYGLVETSRERQWVYYRLASPETAQLVQSLKVFNKLNF